MKRPIEIRTPPHDWQRVLQATYPFLRQQGIGDLLLFGSQALSVYTKTPLRSKDLDLVSSQFGPQHHQALRDHLAKNPDFQVRSTTIQSKPLSAGEMKTYSIELRLHNRPFFIEVFDKILDGKPPGLLTPQVQTMRKWDLDLWVPSPNAVVALRLSFRPPEGMSRLNASRLNIFIKNQRRRLDFKQIGRLIQQWGMAHVVEANLDQLRKKHRFKILYQEEILAATRPEE